MIKVQYMKNTNTRWAVWCTSWSLKGIFVSDTFVQSNNIEKGKRSFEECSFKVALPIISDIEDAHFYLKVALTRKPIAATATKETLVLACLLLQDKLSRKYLIHIKNHILPSEKSTMNVLLDVPIAKNKIMFRDASLKIIYLSLKYRYELSYHIDSQHKTMLTNVSKIEAYDLIRYLRNHGLVTQNDKNNSLQTYVNSLDYGKKIRRYTDFKKLLEQLKKT